MVFKIDDSVQPLETGAFCVVVNHEKLFGK